MNEQEVHSEQINWKCEKTVALVIFGANNGPPLCATFRVALLMVRDPDTAGKFDRR